jgi:hypothetical protein
VVLMRLLGGVKEGGRWWPDLTARRIQGLEKAREPQPWVELGLWAWRLRVRVFLGLEPSLFVFVVWRALLGMSSGRLCGLWWFWREQARMERRSLGGGSSGGALVSSQLFVRSTLARLGGTSCDNDGVIRGCLGFFWEVWTRASGGFFAFFALVIYLAGLMAVTTGMLTGMLKRNDDRIMISTMIDNVV